MVDQRRIDDQRWVDGRTAAQHLGIQLRSLYAYVSRGQVRSLPGARGRARLYALEDLERLRVRRDARAGHGAVAAGALRWGEPVLDSAITAITPRGPAYRGRLAVDLAAAGTPFEHVAELLWSGSLPDAPITWPRAQPVVLGRLAERAPHPIDRMALGVALARLDTDRDPRPDAVRAEGRRLIPQLALALGPVRPRVGEPVAALVARALGLDAGAAPAIDHALVLLADHELNASSFAARVAASTGADPHACIAAALATLSGPRHGTASEEVARFAADLDASGVRAAVRALRRRGELPPGFGHPLYPAGDPRAAPLLALAAAAARTPRARAVLALADATTDAPPNVDVGLAALAAALGAPPEAGAALFAIARAAGWLAHVLEQRAAGFLLRPRARYIGVPPT